MFSQLVSFDFLLHEASGSSKGCLISVLYFAVSYTEAYPFLLAQRPGGSLMSPVVLFSLISQIVVQTVVQVFGFYYVQSQTW